MPSVAVVIPSFNQGSFLRRTLDSVLSQDAPPEELWVIDGGSTDDTTDVLRSFGDAVRWVSEPDHGQAHAVNKGIARTGGDVVAWINSDDVYYPGALAAVRRAFAADTKAEVVYGSADHIDSAGAVLEPYPVEDWDIARLHEVCFLCQPAVFFRRSLVERLGALDASLQYCMDYELWLRYAAAGPFLQLPETLAGSRLYAENKTLGQRVAVHEEICSMLQRVVGRVPVRWIQAYAHAVVESQSSHDRSDPDGEAQFVSALLRTTARAMWRWRVLPDAGTLKEMARWWWAANAR